MIIISRIITVEHTTGTTIISTSGDLSSLQGGPLVPLQESTNLQSNFLSNISAQFVKLQLPALGQSGHEHDPSLIILHIFREISCTQSKYRQSEKLCIYSV